MLKLIEGTSVQSQALAKVEKPESKIVFVQKVIKGDTYLVMAQSAVELEDEFSSLYFTSAHASNLFLMPPFEPNALLNWVQTNNVLNQCVEAMEVNIDGTGHEFVVAEEGGKIDTKEEKIAKAFFEEPYPNISMVSLRRKLRRQMESVGYGFVEVLRNMNDDLVGIRNVETAHVRMVKLDSPIQVKKKLMRDGKEVELTLWERERRFAQRVALKQLVYYREFGTTRHVNRETGDWESPSNPVSPELRGTELIILGIHPDTTTPYYLPRWINELPSVVGSRNAEEQNLQFLDAGGLPPAIVFIQGGTLIKDTSDQLRMYLSGMNKNKNRAVVVEVQSSSGSLDTAGKVDVKVERFGSAQSKDAMYMQYDENTEEHVRVGFRLPPLFLGKAADYNFATAQTAYMVAEAQVFAPERGEFDEVINKTVMKVLKLTTLKFKSKPITLKDVATQLKGLELSKDVATRESFIKEINTVTSMGMVLAVLPHPNVPDGGTHPGQLTISEVGHEQLPASMKPPQITSPQPVPEVPQPEKETHVILKPGDEMHPKPKPGQKIIAKVKVKKSATELITLAHDYAALKGIVKKRELSPERELLVMEDVELLTAEDAHAFNTLIAQYAFGEDAEDLIHIVGNIRG